MSTETTRLIRDGEKGGRGYGDGGRGRLYIYRYLCEVVYIAINIQIVRFVFNSAFIVFNSTCTNAYSCTSLGGEGWVGGCVG